MALGRSAGSGYRGGVSYLGKDVAGSVRSATNDNGDLEDLYEYDAFGKPYKGDLTQGMNLGYTGKPYDSVTGLYNYGCRDYMPEAARFTTEDPVRDGSNWFAYVNNDPVNWVDPDGLLPYNATARDVFTALTNSIGAVFVAVNSQTAKDYTAKNYPDVDAHNNKADAFRHTLWNALNVQDLGVAEAQRFGDAHEANPNQPASERAMDMFNNEVGRRIGRENPDATAEQLSAIVKQAIENGELTTAPKEGEETSYEYGDYVRSGCGG